MLAEQDTFTNGGEPTNKTIKKDMTLLIDGPASVKLISGRAETFGFQIVDAHKIVIREGKRLPFTILENAMFEISLGKGATISEVEGTTIPHTWQTAITVLQEIKTKPALVMVVGGVDLGKSSFCTYLANRLVAEHCRVAVLDEDLGQSDIGPPCTVAYTTIAKPITDLFNLAPENVFFVGVTSPCDAPDKTVEAASKLAANARENTDFVIVNTDGWILGEDAIAFKKHLTNALKPDVVFHIQHRGNSHQLFPAFAEPNDAFKVELVHAPPAIRERNQEERRSFRDQGFGRYLENARTKVFPLGHVIVDRERGVAFFQGQEAKDLLVGLLDSQRRFLGIGVIRGFDHVHKALKVYTRVEEKPAIIVLGKTQLDENLHEFTID